MVSGMNVSPIENNSNICFYLVSILTYKTLEKAKWVAVQVTILLQNYRQPDKRTHNIEELQHKYQFRTVSNSFVGMRNGAVVRGEWEGA